MRRTILFVAALALILALAVPAGAAPKKSYTWNVTCGTDTFTVEAPLGVPGWPDFSKSPILLVGGTFTLTHDGVTDDPFTDPVPAGLVPRVVECSIDGPVGVDPDAFHVHSEPAFMLFTG